MSDIIREIGSTMQDMSKRLRSLEGADTYKPLVVNVKSKGALGDGVTDDSTSIQAAIDSIATASPTEGGIVFFPKGVYRIASGLILPSSDYHGISLIGSGRRTSRLYADYDVTILTLGIDDGNYADYVAGTYGAGAFGTSLKIESLGFQGRWTSSFTTDTSRGITDWGGGHMAIRNVEFVGFDYCAWVINSDINTWNDVEFKYSNYGACLEFRSDQNQFHDCLFTTNEHALILRNNTNCHVQSCVFTFNGDPATDIDICADSTALGGAYVAAGHHVLSDNWHEIWYLMGPKDSFMDIGISGDSVVNECSIMRPFFILEAPPFDMDWRIRAGNVKSLNIYNPLYSQADVYIGKPLLWVSDESGTPMAQHVVIQADWSRFGPAGDWITLEAGSLANVFVVMPEYGTYEAQDERYAIATSGPPRFVMRQLGDANPQIDLGTRRMIYGSGTPGAGVGTWVVGDIIFDDSPVAGGYIGWVCTVAGDPGTWRAWGAILP